MHASAAWGNAPGTSAGARVAPTLEPLALRAGAVPVAVLAGGAHAATVLSEHGHRLGMLEYPVRLAGLRGLILWCRHSWAYRNTLIDYGGSLGQVAKPCLWLQYKHQTVK